ncbi:TPA: AAA family ATPase [Candidatus Poribacteria bacterium]|nr:AAA family ATPase [Candidatus Poribacteria bacterium]HIB85878.1 AAA family ATPase [Candidatus Poribacteria bacterium]HIO09329.1 AAA family ATPase [Candidatus Poribacteria bacterium]
MQKFDLDKLNVRIKEESTFVEAIFDEVGKVIVGQRYMIERLIIGLLCNGHVLLEGVPGLAKTATIQSIASTFSVNFNRIQFTPDLLPADLIGTLIYNPQQANFYTKKGPIFTNIVLADEINRAPAKVQSALLEAMQERQVTIGDETHPLDDPFLVLATQNPIEQEGTYPLPEAQVDRFMLKVKVDYPTSSEELAILRRMTYGDIKPIEPVISPSQIVQLRSVVREIYVDEKIEHYIVSLISATRNPQEYELEDLVDLIEFGASPRATIFLAMAAKAHAFLRHRGFVTPEDVHAIGKDVLRHRIIVSYEAEAEEISSEEIIQKIFESVEIP